MLRRCQNLKHRTLHRMVDLDLELCLKFVQLKVFFIFFKSCLMFSGPFKIILLSEDIIERSYRTYLLKKFNIPRNSWIFFLFVGG